MVLMAAMAAKANATLGIQSANNPAGDRTLQTYSLLRDGQLVTGLPKGNPFTLLPFPDGEENFGPPGGTYVWKAQPADGWKVTAIECTHYNTAVSPPVAVAPRPGEFTYDLANGQVTVDHRVIDDTNPTNDDDQVCKFTNTKVSGGGTTTAGSGVSPTLPGGGGSTLKGPALLRVTAGKGFASARISIARASVIKGELRWKGHVVGKARLKKTKAGTYTLKVAVSKKWQRTFKRQGRKKVTLSLKVTVVGNNKAKKTFTSGVIVRL